VPQVTLSAQSTEYLLARVGTTVAGQQVDPTVDVVEWAFTPRGDFDPQDWVTGEWAPVLSGPDGEPLYVARCLVGPEGGQTVLAPGAYWPWVRITDSPETPVKRVGVLLVE
jgi:hypothetical protein